MSNEVRKVEDSLHRSFCQHGFIPAFVNIFPQSWSFLLFFVFFLFLQLHYIGIIDLPLQRKYSYYSQPMLIEIFTIAQ